MYAATEWEETQGDGKIFIGRFFLKMMKEESTPWASKVEYVAEQIIVYIRRHDGAEENSGLALTVRRQHMQQLLK